MSVKTPIYKLPDGDKRAIWLLRISGFCTEFMLILPVIVLIYTGRGISVGDFFLIQGLFRVAAFLFEIPSGYLSDTFSRRKVLAFGALAHLAGFCVLIFAYGFWPIVLGEALLGIGAALYSGTRESYTYDLLKRSKNEKYFLKEYGTVATFCATAAFIGTILGGILYQDFGGTVLLAIEATVMLGALIAILALPELHEIKRQVKHSAIRDVFGVSMRAVRDVNLRNLILVPAIFSSFTIVVMWILQPVMTQTGVLLSMFGVYVGINQFMRIVFSRYADAISRRFGVVKTSIITTGMLITSMVSVFVAMNTHSQIVLYISCALIAIGAATYKLNDLIYNTLLHHRIESTERGTILSTKQMISTCFGSIILVMMKPLLDGYGIQLTMIVALGILMVIFIPMRYVFRMRDIDKKLKN